MCYEQIIEAAEAAVIITEQLQQRSYRGPNYQLENEALVALMQTLGSQPDRVLEVLATRAMELCRAQSAGISIEEGSGPGDVFRWRAVVGRWEKYVGGVMPRHASPCGTVLRLNRSLLMTGIERCYAVPPSMAAELQEVLLVPFRTESSGDKPVGTVWVLSHSPETRFDREDLRLMESLAAFAGAAYQTLVSSGRMKPNVDPATRE